MFYDNEDDDILNVETPPSSNEEQDITIPDYSDEIDQEVNMAIDMEKKAVVPEQHTANLGEPPSTVHVNPDEHEYPVSTGNKYDDLLQQYKDLQEKRRQNNILLGVMAGGQIAGQGITGRTTGKFDTDLSNIEMLRKMSNQSVEDLEGQVKIQPQITGLRDQSQMRDTSSPISEFFRQMAIKRGFDPQVVEGKSAWDLSEMSKVLGKPQQAGRSFQQVRIRNPETGVIETRLVNMQTGEVGDSVGEAGFAQQVRVNPRSGETIVVNPASGKQVGALSGPAPQSAQAAQAKIPEVNRENLTVSQQKRLDDARKELLDDTKDTRGQLEAAKNINGMINTGGSIDIDFVRAIQNQLARASGERGAMTEGDVAGFGGSPAIIDSLKRWVSLKSFGKLPEEDKKRLSGLAKLMQARAEAYMKQRTAYFTNNMYQDLKAAPNFQGAQIAPQSVEKLIGSDVYTNPNFGKVPVVEIATGKRGFIPEDRVEEAIKSGKFKRVDQ